jgi:putative aldouronate transport system substrate-binding protein
MKKFLMLALVALTAASLAFAAGGGQTQASAPQDLGKRVAGQNYWMAKFDAPVTIHVVNRENPRTPFPAGEDTTKNAWTRGFKQYLNVDIVTDWLSSEDGYKEKLNLAIAAGELPDVFRVNGAQFQQLLAAGLIADLTDYMPNNASDFVNKIMEAAPVVTASAKVNGRLMAMPVYGYGDLWMVDDLWMRHDWVRQAGVSAPKTVADLENIMKTFMAQHPGSYGMVLTKKLYEMYQFGVAYNVARNIWVKGSDGALVYGNIQPQMKDLLAVFADWYKKGYIKQDFTSMEETARLQDLAAGKVGILFEQNWAGWQYTDLIKAQGLEAYMEPYEIPTRDGRPGVFPIGFDNGEYIVVNKNCRNIAAVIKCISFVTWVAGEARLQGAMNEAEEFSYLLGGEGRHTMPPVELADPYGNGPAMVVWAEEVARNNYAIKTPPMFSEWQAQYEQAKPWWESKDPVGYGRWIQQYATPSSASINLKIMNEGRYLATSMTGPLPEEAAAYGETLDDLLTEGFTQIIIGDRPLSYFDTLVAQWKSSGGNVITAAVNRVYGKK